MIVDVLGLEAAQPVLLRVVIGAPADPLAYFA
jgi:hypothetical protein